jgi:hypothetical protein
MKVLESSSQAGTPVIGNKRRKLLVSVAMQGLTASLASSGVHQLNMNELERIRLEFHAVVKALSDHAAGKRDQAAHSRRSAVASDAPISTPSQTASKPSLATASATSSVILAESDRDFITRLVRDTMERELSVRFSQQQTLQSPLPSSVVAGQLPANVNPTSTTSPQAGNGLMQYVPAGWYPVPAPGRL